MCTHIVGMTMLFDKCPNAPASSSFVTTAPMSFRRPNAWLSWHHGVVSISLPSDVRHWERKLVNCERGSHDYPMNKAISSLPLLC